MNELSALQRLTYASVMALFLPFATALADERPNIVVIMADDLGYSDIGCYGSEIDTPNLDELAAGGARFSQFYNTAKCHSSRVSLLTGQYCIAAGDTALSHGMTSAEVLSNAGYFTAMTGKWHLKQHPMDFGFDRYFGHLSGACNYFSGDNSFRLDREPWKVPDTGFYTTVNNVDFALEFLHEARSTSKPWYLYVAFNAPHAPLHALPADYAKYKGRYDRGWDDVRDARVKKQKTVGLLPESLKPSPRPETIPAWDDLEQWKRDYEANRMTTLAAMIDRVDQEIGRLVADLKQQGEFENTLILFVSDNGACPYDRKAPLLDVQPTNAKTSLADSTGWAWARNSPFRFYKQNQFEGGISTPAVVHWPAGLKTPAGSVIHEPAHLIDVLPTLADITGSALPDQWLGRELRPISGVSLKPILDGKSLGKRPPIHLLFAADRGLRDGDWKLVSFQSEAWELYNVANDRSELHNLASQEPARLNSMIAMWNDMTKNVLHAPAAASSPVTKAELPHRHREWTNFDAASPAEYVQRKQRRSAAGTSDATASRKSSKTIRARKNTSMKIVDGKILLVFTGDDPGIAIDLRTHKLPAGPYKLQFELLCDNPTGGTLFYTTNPGQSLPNGKQLVFAVPADEKFHQISINLPTTESLQQLRLDVCENIGQATIANLRLVSEDNQELIAWP